MAVMGGYGRLAKHQHWSAPHRSPTFIHPFLNTWEQNWDQPADEGRDDDTPGRAAAVGVGLLLVFAPSAAQKDGVEEQEEKVQGQAGQRHPSQQKDGLPTEGCRDENLQPRQHLSHQ